MVNCPNQVIDFTYVRYATSGGKHSLSKYHSVFLMGNSPQIKSCKNDTVCPQYSDIILQDIYPVSEADRL